MEDVKWWEKTVEYTFVLRAEQNGLSFLAPLDGDVERIGDAVVGKGCNFFIIEFKKTLSDFDSEYKKYTDGASGFISAKNEMWGMNGCKYHYVIGGSYTDGNDILDLNIKLYFDVESNNMLDIRNIFKEGMDEGELNVYTEKFTSFKKISKDNGEGDNEVSSGGGVENSVVIGVSEGGKVTVIPASYYAKHKKQKKNENNLENKNNNLDSHGKKNENKKENKGTKHRM